MALITRRRFLIGSAASAVALAGYAGWVEPMMRLDVVSHAIRLARWPTGAPAMKILFISDLHACYPWMPPSRIEEIAALGQSLRPDIVLFGGDFVKAVRGFGARSVAHRDWARVLGAITSPLGSFAVLGNHDWWEGVRGMASERALEAAGVRVLRNQSLALTSPGGVTFQLAGLDDQLAYVHDNIDRDGADDMGAALAGLNPDLPTILLAHEPDAFEATPDIVDLTLSGHTHGGQIALPLLGPVMLRRKYRVDLPRGVTVARERHLLVSSGIGMSQLPLRFGVPPEIVSLTVSA